MLQQGGLAGAGRALHKHCRARQGCALPEAAERQGASLLDILGLGSPPDEEPRGIPVTFLDEFRKPPEIGTPTLSGIRRHFRKTRRSASRAEPGQPAAFGTRRKPVDIQTAAPAALSASISASA